MVYSRWYDVFMTPFEGLGLGELRDELSRDIGGKVLEVGGGTGANLRHLHGLAAAGGGKSLISEYVFTDRNLTPRPLHGDVVSFKLSSMEADVQELPFEPESFDTVIATLVMCSVPDQHRGLAEILRVLKPGGRYIFMEHLKPHTHLGGRFADAVTPLWKRIADGCHLNRNTLDDIRDAGFHIERVHRPKFGLFYGGMASKHVC